MWEVGETVRGVMWETVTVRVREVTVLVVLFSHSVGLTIIKVSPLRSSPHQVMTPHPTNVSHGSDPGVLWLLLLLSFGLGKVWYPGPQSAVVGIIWTMFGQKITILLLLLLLTLTVLPLILLALLVPLLQLLSEPRLVHQLLLVVRLKIILNQNYIKMD